MGGYYDLIIIGGGPAGLSAGVYASRAGFKVGIIEATSPGGKLLKTDTVENWPGELSISGVDLAIKFYQHALQFDCTIISDAVSLIEEENGMKKVIGYSDIYTCKAIIIATGTKEKLMGIANEEKFVGRGISYCAVCDGAFYRDKTVAVIGGGNTAVEEALYLSKFAKKIYLFTRREQFRAEQILVDEMKENNKIIHHPNVIVEGIQGQQGKVSAIYLKNVKDDTPCSYMVDGIFPAIGSIPNTDFIKDLGILNEFGYIVTTANMSTSVEGIFAAGDCIDKSLRQIVTATSDGAIAAQAVIAYLQHK